MMRVVQWGCGAMGTAMMTLAATKRGLALVGAIDRRPNLDGRDAAAALGVRRLRGVIIRADADRVLAETRPDIVLLATGSRLREVADPLRRIARAGADAITIAEEMAMPWARAPGLARSLQALAVRHGVTFLGTGINPGFALDTLILALTGVCHRVTSIEAARVNDLGPYGPAVMRAQGIGLTPAAFARGVRDGTVAGHIGFAESIALLDAALGLGIDRVVETKVPIVARVARAARHARVAPGQVAGCRHTARGLRRGRPVITLMHPQQVQPQREGVRTGDTITIRGVPDVHLKIEPELPGGLGTAALAVNMIPAVRAAAPGLVTMADLPVPRCLPAARRKGPA